MLNFKFNYLYRDGGNYKNYGAVVVANPENLSLLECEKLIRAKLINDTWFYAEEWKVPKLFFADFDPTDPIWHEFESVDFCDESASTSLSHYLCVILIT
jgi:hypothetical protein